MEATNRSTIEAAGVVLAAALTANVALQLLRQRMPRLRIAAATNLLLLGWVCQHDTSAKLHQLQASEPAS